MQKMPSNKIYLVDTSSLIFRAYYAIRPLSTKAGYPTNAIYGFTTMLLSLIEKHSPAFLACVLDTGAPSFRKELFPQYKSNRGAPPVDLMPQFEGVAECIASLGVRSLSQPTYEADDLIATLVRRFPEESFCIVSSDKDLMQLVNERVTILDTMKDKEYGPQDVVEKLGVHPSQVTDYLGLVGDASDFIPGIPGVGPKTAAQLLKEYSNLETLLDAIPQMAEGKKKKLLQDFGAQARLSKKLATLHSSVPGHCTEIALQELALKEMTFNSEPFLKFLTKMEFHGLLKKYSHPSHLNSSVEVGASYPETSVVTVQTEQAWKKCLQSLENAPLVAFDTETKGDRVTEVELVGVSLCGNANESYYIPVRHQGIEQLSFTKVLDDLNQLFINKKVVAQNLKYDYRVFLKEGCKLKTPVNGFFDTMLADYLIQPEEKHGLDALAMRYLGKTIGDFKETLGAAANFSEVPLEHASRYAAWDAWSTFSLYEPLKKGLIDSGQLKLFEEIEVPTALVLAEMELVGIKVDLKILEALSGEYAKELQRLEKQIFEHTGTAFNLNSPKQLSEILFDKLGLPALQKTKTGYSTDVTVLERLAPLHPVPAMIVEYREFSKLKSTYIDAFPDLVEKDGRIHANFNQAVTATGRLSSSNPNLQNIPIKTERGRKIRRAFISEPGYCLVGADYSQIELRLVAHLSGDQSLMQAFSHQMDVHRATASEIFNLPMDEVTDAQRSAAKAINFGLIYGKTAYGLSQELHLPKAQAQAYIDSYFRKYEGVQRYMKTLLEQAKYKKFAETLFGRKRPLKDIDNKNFSARAGAERMAINTPVQGTAADLMKIAMIKAHEACSAVGGKIVLQVHDELVIECPVEKSEQVLNCLKSSMEGVAKLQVPLEVHAGVASHWLAL